MSVDVLVAGSLHLDILVHASRMPAIDETLIGSSWHNKPGGKGGNQAVAAAAAGATTAMLGAVGEDDFGQRLLANLQARGVDCSAVARIAGGATGMSVAILDRAGDYAAVVVSGVNRTLVLPLALPQCKILLLQNEIPEAVNLAVARLARQHGARIVLNAAPARLLSPELAGLIDILIVNRIEAGMVTARTVASADDAIAVLPLLGLATTDVIVTLGSAGLVVGSHGKPAHSMPATPVVAINSHGAGDVFCGALAARLANGMSLIEAARAANADAGRFVTLPSQ